MNKTPTLDARLPACIDTLISSGQPGLFYSLLKKRILSCLESK